MTSSKSVWLGSAPVSTPARVALAGIGVVLVGFFAMVFETAFASGSWLGLLLGSYVFAASVCSRLASAQAEARFLAAA